MADQEFLASYAVEIDEAGVTRLQEILAQNKELADSLTASFSAATEAINAFQESLGSLPSFSSGTGSVTEGLSGAGALTLGLNTAEAQQQLENFIALAKKPVSLSANASGIVSAARSAYENVRSIFSSPITIQANVQTSKGDNSDGSASAGESIKMSTGGRFTAPTDVQVAEDGDTEYIIPVKKEDKAIPLLKQLLGELSPAARQSLNLENMNMPIPGAAEENIVSDKTTANVIAGETAANIGMGNITQNNQNVSAPVSIQVNATNSNPEQIGKSVYNMAERYLLRTMKGVFA